MAFILLRLLVLGVIAAAADGALYLCCCDHVLAREVFTRPAHARCLFAAGQPPNLGKPIRTYPVRKVSLGYRSGDDAAAECRVSNRYPRPISAAPKQTGSGLPKKFHLTTVTSMYNCFVFILFYVCCRGLCILIPALLWSRYSCVASEIILIPIPYLLGSY